MKILAIAVLVSAFSVGTAGVFAQEPRFTSAPEPGYPAVQDQAAADAAHASLYVIQPEAELETF